jgi:hypothetical protein
MRKEYAILFLAFVLLLLLFTTQWTYIEGALPMGIAMLRGQASWMSITLLLVPVVAFLLIILNRVSWLPIIGIIGLAPFAYFIGNLVWESYKLSAEGNFLIQRDSFFMFRFFSPWLWVHLGVAIVFALGCFYPSKRDEDEEETDVQTLAS